uniref:Uncharacterized protein n=1 Tax=Monodelphis domestica TaxID=13616 RepID=A0A5F8GKL3_MONDO
MGTQESHMKGCDYLLEFLPIRNNDVREGEILETQQAEEPCPLSHYQRQGPSVFSALSAMLSVLKKIKEGP